MGNHGNLRMRRSRSAQYPARIALSAQLAKTGRLRDEEQITGRVFRRVLFEIRYARKFSAARPCDLRQCRSGLTCRPRFYRE